MYYGSEIKTMLPKLHSENFSGLELIRPLYLVREKDVLAWRDYNNLEFLNCACKFTELISSVEKENISKRKEIKKLIASLKEVNPNIDNNIFNSINNINLNTVLGYKKDGVKYSLLDDYDKVSRD